jgi:hypothetical protein
MTRVHHATRRCGALYDNLNFNFIRDIVPVAGQSGIRRIGLSKTTQPRAGGAFSSRENASPPRLVISTSRPALWTAGILGGVPEA